MARSGWLTTTEHKQNFSHIFFELTHVNQKLIIPNSYGFWSPATDIMGHRHSMIPPNLAKVFFLFIFSRRRNQSLCVWTTKKCRSMSSKTRAKPQACDGDSGWWTANNFFGIDNQNYLMQLHRWLIQKHDLPMSAFIVCADQNQITIFCARRSDDAINIASTFFSGLFCKDHWSMIYYFLRTICKKANLMGKVQCPKLTVDGWWWAKIIIQRQRGWHNRHKVPKYMY